MRKIKQFISREIAGESILIPVGKTAQEFNGMISLTPTAKCIWENIEKVSSLEELVNIIVDEFEVDGETARKDAIIFIAKLMQKEFVETTKEDKSW